MCLFLTHNSFLGFGWLKIDSNKYKNGFRYISLIFWQNLAEILAQGERIIENFIPSHLPYFLTKFNRNFGKSKSQLKASKFNLKILSRFNPEFICIIKKKIQTISRSVFFEKQKKTQKYKDTGKQRQI